MTRLVVYTPVSTESANTHRFLRRSCGFDSCTWTPHGKNGDNRVISQIPITCDKSPYRKLQPRRRIVSVMACSQQLSFRHANSARCPADSAGYVVCSTGTTPEPLR